MTNLPESSLPGDLADSTRSKIGLWLVFSGLIFMNALWPGLWLMAKISEVFRPSLYGKNWLYSFYWATYFIHVLLLFTGALLVALGAQRQKHPGRVAAWISAGGFGVLLIVCISMSRFAYLSLESSALTSAALISLFVYISVAAEARGSNAVAVLSWIALGGEVLRLLITFSDRSFPSPVKTAIAVFIFLSQLYNIVVVLCFLLTIGKRAAGPRLAPYERVTRSHEQMATMPIDAETKGVLDLRLAKAEITQEQYRQLVQTMQTGPGPVPGSAAWSVALPGLTRQLNQHLYSWAILGGTILSALLGLGGLLYLQRCGSHISSTEWSHLAIFLVLAVPFMILATATWMTLLYRSWQALQPYGARTTPGKAIGFLFIPLFNLYWIFVAYHGLAKDFNRVASMQSDPQAPRLAEGIPLAVCILCCLSLIPYLGLLLAIPTVILFLIFAQRLIQGVNALIPRPQSSTK